METATPVPEIKGDDILVNTDFYAWLQERKAQGHNDTHFIPSINAYVGNVKAAFKGRDDLQAHKYVFEAFWHLQYRKVSVPPL